MADLDRSPSTRGRSGEPRGADGNPPHASHVEEPAMRLSPTPARSLLRSTLLALLQPRRIVPILLVAIPLVVAQVRWSAHPLAGPLGAVMCVAFFLLGPVSWRALFPADDPEPRTFTAPFGRLVVFAVAGAGTVYTVGAVLPGVLGLPVTFMTTDTSLLVSVALFWVGGYGLGRDIDLEASLQFERRRARALAHEAERAQLLALRTHLDPHFLFNTLNAIAEWCREDGETAERATLELSSMLRSVLEASRRGAWPMRREIELSQALLDLHRIRDPERLVVRTELDPIPAVEVPPMILLPLTENAMKHGPCAGHRGEVVMRVHAVGDEVVFEIDNPGRFAGPRAGGEGLELVRRRLAHAYGGAARFEIAAHGERTKARVRIPLHAGPEIDA
jgi:two-component system sensor histidine kinase AlgZ